MVCGAHFLATGSFLPLNSLRSGSDPFSLANACCPLLLSPTDQATRTARTCQAGSDLSMPCGISGLAYLCKFCCLVT